MSSIWVIMASNPTLLHRKLTKIWMDRYSIQKKPMYTSCVILNRGKTLNMVVCANVDNVDCVQKFMLKMPHILFHQIPFMLSMPAHLLLLSLHHPVFFHSSFILSHFPFTSTSSVQPTPFSLWHKTDWGWLVLSWLLRSSTGHSAAGVGGGAGSSSRAGQPKGQEAGSSSPAKPAGGWTWPRHTDTSHAHSDLGH